MKKLSYLRKTPFEFKNTIKTFCKTDWRIRGSITTSILRIVTHIFCECLIGNALYKMNYNPSKRRMMRET